VIISFISDQCCHTPPQPQTPVIEFHKARNDYVVGKFRSSVPASVEDFGRHDASIHMYTVEMKESSSKALFCPTTTASAVQMKANFSVAEIASPDVRSMATMAKIRESRGTF
jgi:hypothetical protein